MSDRPAESSAPPSQNDVVGGHIRLPSFFVENRGQADPRAVYYLSGSDTSVALTRSGVAFGLPDRGGTRWGLVLGWEGARATSPVGLGNHPSPVNYLKGHPGDWLTEVPSYGRVAYRDLWPGIDLVFTSSAHGLKYAFRVDPGADPRAIHLAWRGASTVDLRDEALHVGTPAGEVIDHPPIAYQPSPTGRVEVRASYRQGADGSFRFQVDPYELSLPLVIDPEVTLRYATFLGGSGEDTPFDIAMDPSGAAYVTGRTFDAATEFPTTPGAFDPSHNGSLDAFVAKLTPSGDALAYATFLGGSFVDIGYAIAVDPSGAAYVTGSTGDAPTDLPTTPGAIDTSHNGVTDAFVAKLTPAGDALAYSTFVGGSGFDEGRAIDVDASGAAYVAGNTPDATIDLPTTPGAFDTSPNGSQDAFVAKLTPAGDALAYSTFLGGSGFESALGIAVAPSGAASVTGSTPDVVTDLPTTPGAFDTSHNGAADVFVTTLAPTGTSLAYSTYLGGSGTDFGLSIAVDLSGAAFVTGDTEDAAIDFPTTPGAFDTTHNGGAVPPPRHTSTTLLRSPGSGGEASLQGGSDAFVARLTPSGDALTYSTFLGGSHNDSGLGVAVDLTGVAHVAGRTADGDIDFPTTPGAIDPSHNGFTDAFVAGLAPAGNALLYSTFIGGSGGDIGTGISVDLSGAPSVTVATSDATTHPPTTPGAFDTSHNGDLDAYVAALTSPYGCRGRPATLVGSEGPDLLTGTGGRDVIQAFGGNDRIAAGAGNDRVCAGAGNDRVNARGGNDLVRGERGRDRLKGGSGKDGLAGGGGRDTLWGGGGNDRLAGGGGKGDACNGGAGTDRAACEQETKVP